MQRVPLLLVVLVALAGCSGVFGGGNDEIETLTPASVPTDEPTPTPVPRLAPGLTVAGVVNSSALAAAHDALLENTSFTARQTVTYRRENGTPVRRVTSVTRIGKDGRFRITKRWSGQTHLRRKAYYYDSERLLVATSTDNATTYHRASPEMVAFLRSVAGVGSGQIERVFLAAETRVVGRTERNGTTVYHLVPENVRFTDTSIPDRSVSVQARITARGLVRAYTFRQTLSDEGSGGTAVIVVSTRYTEVGSTTVERPAWYDKPVAKTNVTVSN